MRKPLSSLDDFLEPYDPSVRTLFFQTRTFVLNAAPRANELIYDAYNAVTCAYSYSERLKEAFCHVAAYRKHVNLGFNQGAGLDDPHGLLVGSGARIRHIRISSVDEFQDERIHQLLKLAIAHGDEANLSAGANGVSIVKAIYDQKRPRS